MVMSLATPTTLLRAATRCLNTDGTMRFWNIQIGGAGWDFTRTPLPSGPCVRVRGQVPAMCGALPTEAIVGIAVGGALLLAAGVLMVRRRGGRGKGSSAGKGQAKAHA